MPHINCKKFVELSYYFIFNLHEPHQFNYSKILDLNFKIKVN